MAYLSVRPKSAPARPPTRARHLSSMLIFLGFVTANEPESTGEYAVSGGGPEQPFAKDFALPAEFVQMSRHPRVAERQKARRRERDEAMHRQMQAERSEAEYLKAREEIRKVPPSPAHRCPCPAHWPSPQDTDTFVCCFA